MGASGARAVVFSFLPTIQNIGTAILVRRRMKFNIFIFLHVSAGGAFCRIGRTTLQPAPSATATL
jgi:hypothetical protein